MSGWLAESQRSCVAPELSEFLACEILLQSPMAACSVPMENLRLSAGVFCFPASQERKGHINSRKIPGTPAGCPWDTRRDKQGSTGRCPRDFLLFTIEKRTEKGIFAGTPAGCPRDTRPSRRFSENLCDFFLWAFSAPYPESAVIAFLQKSEFCVGISVSDHAGLSRIMNGSLLFSLQ